MKKLTTDLTKNERRKKYNRLIEQHKSILEAMNKACADDNMAEYHRLNGHLIWLDEKLERAKNDWIS